MKIVKIISIAIMMLVCTQVSFAQDGKIRKADKLYNSKNYIEAAKRYKQLDSDDINIIRKEAECYRHLGQYQASEVLYERIVTMESRIPEDYYNYSYVLRANKKYAESDKQLAIFNSLNAADRRGVLYVSDKNYLENIMADEQRYEIKNLDFNTSEQEFSPVLYDDKLIFSSSRSVTGPSLRIYNRNRLSFLNLYASKINDDGSFSKPKQFKKKLNKKYHEGPVSFNRSGDIMAVTRNNYKNKSSDGFRNLEIFFSYYEDGKWTKPVPFEHNNKEYSVGHAFLYDDGNTMYFVSDMPGGIGGTDIYKVTRQADNTWSMPENLGDLVNTEGNEMFPFVSAQGNLIFSSDGHLGLGGLDLFITNPNQTEVTNMGVPLNSNRDDFGFFADDKMEQAYFSSNRDAGNGFDDIYSVRILDPIEKGKIIKGTVFDQENNILANATVTLYNKERQQINTLVTGNDGSYLFYVDADKDYEIVGRKDEYFESTNKINTKTKEEEIISDLILSKESELISEKASDFSLLIRVIDNETKAPLEAVSIKLIDEITKTHSAFTTSTSGTHKKALEDKRLNDIVKYELIIEKEGYASKVYKYDTTLTKSGQYDIDISLDLLFKDEIAESFELVEIEPIYFDFDKYDIRPDAAIGLDKIVSILNKYPNLVLEFSSHTDSRASAAYNLSLSEKRAKATADYIKSRIVNPERVSGKGYGETQLVNHCVSEGEITEPCSERDHQLNRRSEFKIITNGKQQFRMVH